ncbi:MAG: hypothetical protein AAF639_30430 [Chloroflexota bacterium]
MLSGDLQHDRMASLLCYLGALTIDGATQSGKIQLVIPNLVMRNLYAERIIKMAIPDSGTLRQAQLAADALFTKGDIEPLCRFIEANHMSIFSNRDYPQFKELTLKTLFITLLYHNHLYVIDSEPELRRGYGDLLMLVRPGKRHYTLVDLLFEFKQLRLGQLEKPSISKGNESDPPTYKGKEIKGMTRTELMAIPAVRRALDEAKEQLGDYVQVLDNKYGDDLRLRSFAVVGVGFERVVWEKI